MQIHAATADASLACEAKSASLFHRVWPPAFIACGLGLTAAWVSFLGYEVVRFIVG